MKWAWLNTEEGSAEYDVKMLITIYQVGVGWWVRGCVGAWVSEGSTEYDVKILITKKPGGCGGVGWGVCGCVGERGID